MTTEDYKMILNRGFRIIRPKPATCSIQVMIRHDRWSQLGKYKTPEQMYRAFEILLQDEKTIKYNS